MVVSLPRLTRGMSRPCHGPRQLSGTKEAGVEARLYPDVMEVTHFVLELDTAGKDTTASDHRPSLSLHRPASRTSARRVARDIAVG